MFMEAVCKMTVLAKFICRYFVMKNWTRFNNINKCNYLEKIVISKLHANVKYTLCVSPCIMLKPSMNHNRMFIVGGILSFLMKDDAEKEPELIITIKRGVLLIQKGEHKKAEQMFHLALKIAQEQQNEDGVIYIFDLLANLAYEQGEYNKAEKLFISVMQHLLSKGIFPNDNKILHISLKLANIYNIYKDKKKAEEGFKFCVNHLEKKINQDTDEDTLLLWAMTLDWYARFLLSNDRPNEAFKYFQKAYDMSVSIHGETHEQTVVLLNDLGTVSFLCEDYDLSLKYLNEAIQIGKKLPEMNDFASVHVNLGSVYMKKQMYNEAKLSCKEAWRNAKMHNNKEALHEASSCLDEVNKYLKNTQ